MKADTHLSEELLWSYADGEVSEGERAQVEAHLSTCESCGRTLAAHRSMLFDLRALPMERAPEGFLDAVRARVEAEERAFWRPARWLAWLSPSGWGPRVVVALATAVLVVVVLRSPEAQREDFDLPRAPEPVYAPMPAEEVGVDGTVDRDKAAPADAFAPAPPAPAAPVTEKKAEARLDAEERDASALPQTRETVAQRVSAADAPKAVAPASAFDEGAVGDMAPSGAAGLGALGYGSGGGAAGGAPSESVGFAPAPPPAPVVAPQVEAPAQDEMDEGGEQEVASIRSTSTRSPSRGRRESSGPETAARASNAAAPAAAEPSADVMLDADTTAGVAKEEAAKPQLAKSAPRPVYQVSPAGPVAEDELRARVGRAGGAVLAVTRPVVDEKRKKDSEARDASGGAAEGGATLVPGTVIVLKVPAERLSELLTLVEELGAVRSPGQNGWSAPEASSGEVVIELRWVGLASY